MAYPRRAEGMRLWGLLVVLAALGASCDYRRGTIRAFPGGGGRVCRLAAQMSGVPPPVCASCLRRDSSRARLRLGR
jgi:hypothetical protein